MTVVLLQQDSSKNNKHLKHSTLNNRTFAKLNNPKKTNMMKKKNIKTNASFTNRDVYRATTNNGNSTKRRRKGWYLA